MCADYYDLLLLYKNKKIKTNQRRLLLFLIVCKIKFSKIRKLWKGFFDLINFNLDKKKNDSYFWNSNFKRFHGSSMVEHSAVNRRVVSSSLTRGAK